MSKVFFPATLLTPQQGDSVRDLLRRIALDVVPHEFVVFGSASRSTTTTEADDRVNPGYRGVLLVVNCTVFGGGTGFGPSWVMVDPVTGSLSSHAHSLGSYYVAGTGVYYYVSYPGATSSAMNTSTVKTSVSTVLPARFRFRVVHSDATAHTYSLGAIYIP